MDFQSSSLPCTDRALKADRGRFPAREQILFYNIIAGDPAKSRKCSVT